MAIVKGYTQLDLEVINNIPIAPSIIPSLWDGTRLTTSGQRIYRENITFFGTELISYFKTYFPIEYSGLLNALSDETINEYIIEINGFIPTQKLNFRFYFQSGFTVDISTYGNVSFSLGPNLDVTGSTSRENKISYLENGQIKIYFVLPPDHTRTGSPRILAIVESPRISNNQFYARNQTQTRSYVLDFLNVYFFNKPKDKEPDNPVGEPPFSGENIKTDIEHPELPTVSLLNGMHNMYQPDLQIVKQVSKSLWSRAFFDNVLKIFNNPIESIVSLTLSPIQPPISDNVSKIIVGNLPLVYTESGGAITNVYSRTLTNQYGTYSFGKLSLYENYANYLDYNTSVEIFIPFIGIQKLSVDDVMSKILSLEYNVDFFTGDFIATLKCSDSIGNINSVLYHWKGNLLSHAPLSSSNFSTTFLNGLNTVMSVGMGNTSALIGNIQGYKPDVSKGGNTSGNVGALDNFKAYLILTKPIESKPSNYNKLKGLISNIDNKLTLGMGYIICDEIHIKNVNATDEEKNELEKLFKSGVIL